MQTQIILIVKCLKGSSGMAAVHMHNFENISAAEEIIHINHAVYKSIERNVCAHVLSMCTITCINKNYAHT